MVKLKAFITNNNAIIGSNFENIGKFTGRGLRRHKLLLSYNKANGWDLIKLNIFQLFLRSIGLRFQSTRLSVVIDGFNVQRYKKKDNNPLLEKHLKDFWAKKYPKKHQPSFGIFTGNSTVDKAQLICLTEIHTDKANKHLNYEIIEKMYRPGDVILVEGVDAGHDISGKLHDTLLNYTSASDGLQIFGWEPLGQEAQNKQLWSVSGNVHLKLNAAKDELIKKTPSTNSFSEQDKQFLVNEIEQFGNSLGDVVRHYQTPARATETINHYKKTLLYFLNAKDLNHPEAVFKYCISEICKKIHREVGKRKYEHLTPEERKIIQATFHIRNESLCNEIRKHCQQNRRVFVIAGKAHFLESSSKIKDVESTIAQYKHVIVVPKNTRSAFLNVKSRLKTYKDLTI